MRFMVIIKATTETEAGVMPSEKLLTEMGRYNEELVKAGVMQAGEGLHPSSKGARVKFSGSKRTATDGPFGETKDLVGGYLLVTATNLDAATELARGCPILESENGSVEVREVREMKM